MQKIYFIDGKAVTKTQLLNDAESESLKTCAKNKRRLREGLIFRPVKNYKSWGQFLGNCQLIGHNSVPNISIRGIIFRALESRGVTDPCIAVFRLSGQSFVYSEKGKPVIYNAKLLVERGGTWLREEDDEGYVIDWYLGDRDADRTQKNELLLTEEVPFPSDMSDDWQEICIERYGRVYDKYHIIPV